MSRKSSRVKDNGAAAVETPGVQVPLKELTVNELRRRCDGGGIVIPPGYVKKDDLIKLLKDSGGGAVSVSGQGAEVSGQGKEVSGEGAEVSSAMSDSDDKGHDMSHTEIQSSRRSPPPSSRKTQKTSPVKEEDPSTPTTPELTEKISDLEKYGYLWFETTFLQMVLQVHLMTSREFPPNPTPTLFVLIGPASSGKSNVRESLFKKEMAGAINIDVDKIKLVANDNLPGGAGNYSMHMQAVLAKMLPNVFQLATRGGKGHYKNIILDTTGSMKPSIKKYMQYAKKFDYNVSVIIVYSTKELCMKRVKGRNAKLELEKHHVRVISTNVVAIIYDEFLREDRARYYATHPSITKRTDDLYLIDNSSDDEPVTIFHRKSPGVIITGPPKGHPLIGNEHAFYGLTILDESIRGGNTRKRYTQKKKYIHQKKYTHKASRRRYY